MENQKSQFWTQKTKFGSITWNKDTMDFVDVHGSCKYYSIDGTGVAGRLYKGTAIIIVGDDDIDDIIDIERIF